MRSKLIVKLLHLNALKRDVEPDTGVQLLKIQCLRYRKKLHLSYKDQPSECHLRKDFIVRME